MATLITKNSSTASSIPTAVQLVQGELAVNVTDKRLFTENSAGAVVELGTNPSSITTGTLTATGNVGIGTTNPIAKLDINKGSAGLLANFTDGVNTNFQISTTSLLATVGPAAGSTNLALQTGGVERVRISANGDVGIGTSSPVSPLTVTSNSSAAIGITIKNRSGNDFGALYFTTNDGATVQTGIVNALTGTNGANLLFNRKPDGGASTEAMRIDSSGTLLVGTTLVPNVGQAQFGFSVSSTEVVISKNVNTPALFIKNASGNSTAINFYNGTNQVGSISTNTTSTAYNTASDYRLKNTVAPMTGALARVAALRPCTYKWIADGSDGQGFIAHELAEVEPGCVSGKKDAVDAEGKPQHQGIDTSFLVATLAAAIQEQQVLIKDLTDRLAALEAK